MASLVVTEGRFSEQAIRSGQTLIVVHGGPTFGHNYLLPLQELARLDTVQSVIFYDQIGCGRSTKLPEKRADSSFWNLDLLRRELANLVAHLDNISPESNGKYSVIGHSVGALFTSMFAATQPPDLHKLVLSNGLASLKLLHKSNMVLLAAYPPVFGEKIIEREEFLLGQRADCRFSQEEYMEALITFRSDHALRIPPPYPATLVESLQNLASAEDSLLGFAGGHVEMFFGGSLVAEDVTPALANIIVPTLVVNGEWDKATPMTSQPFVDLIPNVQRSIIANTSHLSYLEDKDEYMAIVSRFLLE